MSIHIATNENGKNQSKIRQIYVKYFACMYGKAMRILHNEHDAEDAVQEAFLRIIDHIDDIPDVDSAKAQWYVVTIVANVAIDMWRRKKRFPELAYDDAISMGDSTEPYLGENKIVKVMLQLSVKDREYLVLKHIYGYKNAEIGKQLNMTENAVKQAVNRAEKRFREKCKEDGLV